MLDIGISSVIFIPCTPGIHEATLGTSSVRVAEKSEDSLMPEAKNLLDRPGGLEMLAEMAIRRAQTAPMHTIPGVKTRQR